MEKWINLCFCIDESGSMYPSMEDVIGGFQSIIDEQKKNNEGKVTVSLYKFNHVVTEVYRGVDVNDIEKFDYHPDGCTALYDGVGVAIDDIGKWLHERDENGEQMPDKTLMVVMTDGYENSSKEYTLEGIQERIKRQTDVYSWEFVYVGTDLSTKKPATSMGFSNQVYNTRSKMKKGYDMINWVTSAYRNFAGSTADAALSLKKTLCTESLKSVAEYEADTGKKLED